jgi:hypothetical protein
MKKNLLLAVFALALGTLFSFKPADEHLKGYIDDSMCAASTTPMCTPATRVNCAQKCIKSGALAVLVVDGKVYKISNQKAVIKYAGKNVNVDGKITNDSIEVTKIEESKS